MTRCEKREDGAARALEFTILTAARTGGSAWRHLGRNRLLRQDMDDPANA